MDTVTLIYPGPGARIVPALDAKVPADVPVAVPVGEVADGLLAQGWQESDLEAVTPAELAELNPRRRREDPVEVDGQDDGPAFVHVDDIRKLEGLPPSSSSSAGDGEDTTTDDAGDGTTEEN